MSHVQNDQNLFFSYMLEDIVVVVFIVVLLLLLLLFHFGTAYLCLSQD